MQVWGKMAKITGWRFYLWGLDNPRFSTSIVTNELKSSKIRLYV